MGSSGIVSAQEMDRHASELARATFKSVHGGAKATSEKRYQVLFDDFPHGDELRVLAGKVKQHTLENLGVYLRQAEAVLESHGVTVHWAGDASEANRIATQILKDNGAKKVVKSKSMVTEETHLGDALVKEGIECLETDLGEYIVQIDGDHPSHIVKPIIHKSRQEIARSFEREGLGEYNDDPTTITRRARTFLREKYLEADAAITGANFISAQSGRLVLVTNEGNARFCLAANPLHIAMVGIEKLVPTDRDLALFLNLLARSGTGQPLTVYTQFLNGPRATAQEDGPAQMHVIFVDNGRSEVLAGDCREILRCIRCGACLNVCPVYRQTSGHAYRSVYPGPVGAVLSPLLAGKKFPELADLPKASSLCGACNEVCPVNIPIPDLLLKLRDRGKKEGAKKAMAGTPPMGPFAILATSPAVWKTSLRLGHTMNLFPKEWIPHPAARAWQSFRKLPSWKGGEFRSWFRNRSK